MSQIKASLKENSRILFGVPTRFHIEIALDEMKGLEELGYCCDKFNYAAKTGFSSPVRRVFVIIMNALNLVFKAYQFTPNIIYINSRLEKLGSTRDFITIFLFKLLYFKKVKFAIKSHGSDIDVLKDRSIFLRKIIFPFLKNKVSAWLFLSNEEKERMEKLNYFPINRLHITKNIVRQYQFRKSSSFRREFGITESCRILLFVGRIIEKKGIYDVIEAYRIIVQKYNVRLIIVGDGTDFDEMKKKINEYDLEKHILITGFISEHEVVKYYSNSDILLFPTYDSEGFPMALFNSVSSGLSIITTKIRAAADYLKEPDNCLWVEPKNPQSIIAALEQLLTDPSLINKTMENNKLLGVQFNQKAVSEELSQIIEKILE
jgi:glycosyltransferase involved in cell wall biosynthesis